MRKTLILVGLLLWVSGCVSLPRTELTPTISTEELSGHVEFLAHPALKGRKPRTWGSRRARQHIERQFSALGLEPWGQAKGFAQPFLLGTNVVGILPGSDPNLADEVVMLMAHYDHLGRTQQGMCLGACDNASAVAALLEMAESLALAEDRPKRSICFAAWDCEEDGLLGAFAFTARPDFDPNRIAGVVNVDLLGRQGFGVLENHLFVSGTESYRPLREQIHQAAQDRIDMLAAGTDIVGPRGDHVPFEGMDFPCLFFSCGLYEDYHRPTDTVDKLDYSQIQQSALVIADTVSLLANRPERYQAVPPQAGDLEELQVLDLCLEQLLLHRDLWEVSQADTEIIESLMQYIKQLPRDQTYSNQQRETMIRKAVMALYPILSRFDVPITITEKDPEKAAAQKACYEAGQRLGLLCAFELRADIAHTGRDMIQHLPTNPWRFLLPLPSFERKNQVITPIYLDLSTTPQGDHLLTYAIFKGKLSVKWPGLFFLPFHPDWLAPAFQVEVKHAFGTHDEIIDACLLQWFKHQEPSSDPLQGLDQVMQVVRGNVDVMDEKQYLNQRLQQGSWQDPNEWLEHVMQSNRIQLATQSIKVAWKREGHDFNNAMQAILSDPNKPRSILWTAIKTLDSKSNQATLKMLADWINAPEPNYLGQLRSIELKDQDHPLMGLFYCINDYVDKHKKLQALTKKPPKKIKKIKPQPQTVPQLAQKKLKEITRQDFGDDAEAWKRWIETHWQKK